LNTLPIRSELGGDPTFATVLASVRDAAIGAYANADIPFERLVQALADGARHEASPLFNVMFVLEHANPATVFRLGDAVLTPLERGQQQAKFDLSLSMRAHPDDTITFEWEVDLGRVDAGIAETMVAIFPALIERLCESPDTSLSNMPLVAAAIETGGGQD